MFSHSPFFPLPGSVVALPNKLFNPVLSSCIGALVLLLLLLLFLLYKYNQVRFPVQGKGCEGCPASGAHSLCWQPGQGPSSLEGPGKLPPSRPLPPRFHLEFPAAGPRSCTQPRGGIKTSPALLLQPCSPRVSVVIVWCQTKVLTLCCQLQLVLLWSPQSHGLN